MTRPTPRLDTRVPPPVERPIDPSELLSPMEALLGDEGDSSRQERMTLVSDADRRRAPPQPHQRTALQRAEDTNDDDDEMAPTAPLEDDASQQDILPDRITREPR